MLRIELIETRLRRPRQRRKQRLVELAYHRERARSVGEVLRIELLETRLRRPRQRRKLFWGLVFPQGIRRHGGTVVAAYSLC